MLNEDQVALVVRIEEIVNQIAELTTADAWMFMPTQDRAAELKKLETELEETKRGLSSVSG